MNTALNLHRLRPSPPSRAIPGLLLTLNCLLACSLLPLQAQYQSDDFNDGNDNQPTPGWTRYDPLGGIGAGPQATFSFPNGGYRIQTRPSPNPALVGPGRAGSLREDVSYTNFYASVDIVNWNENVNQTFGIIARVREPGLGTTDGYAFTYDFGGKDLDITRFINEDTRPAAGGGGIGTGPDRADFVHGRVYRLVAVGRGADLTVRLYELPDTQNPIASVSGTETSPNALTEGFSGLLIYDNSNQAAGGIAPDITFDNFYATDVEPPRIKMTDTGFGTWELSWPKEASEFVLKSSTVLPGSAQDWTDVPGVQAAEDRFFVWIDSDPALGGLPKQFYQLVRPAPGN